MLPKSLPVEPRSRLERLPVEIIQTIFLRSLEINLPRASIHIARTLSDPIIYTWLIRLAFSGANKSSTRCFFTPDYLPSPLDFFTLSPQERRDLQTRILDCRWCTLQLIRKCQREYVNHVINRICHDLEFSGDTCHILDNLDSRFGDLADSDDGRDGRRGKGDLILKAKTRCSNADRKVAIWFHFGAFQVREPNELYFERDIFRLPSCAIDLPARIPDKLLCGPWTESKFEFLRLLSMDAYIDEDSTHTRSKRILRQVIRSRDFRTFERLVNLYIRMKDYRFPTRWPLHPSHFHVAMKCADEHHDPFVRLLVEQRWDDIPPHDVMLKERLLSRVGKDTMNREFTG